MDRKKRVVLVFFLLVDLLFLVYCLNFRVNETYDSIPAKYVALSLLREGNPDLDEYAPFLRTTYLSDPHESSFGVLPYYLVEGTGPAGRHVLSNSGVGVALLLVPAFYSMDRIKPLDARDIFLLAAAGRVVMSFFSALAAGFLYLILVRVPLSEGTRIVLPCAFALGTAMWTTASEGTWQHGPAVFLVVLMLYFLVLSGGKSRHFSYSAIPASLALCLRPALLPLVLCLFLYGALYRRKELPLFVLLAMPALALNGLYHYYYFGSPFIVSAQKSWASVALIKTGSPLIWQTGYFTGLWGNLFSPSRGLFVYSPFLLFALYSLFHRGGAFERPLVFFFAAGSLSLTFMPSMYFDWWGGVCYGNRYLLEGVPLLVLLIAHQSRRIMASPFLVALFMVFLVFSIVVQYAGSALYDGLWDIMNHVDRDHGKLWDWHDSQLRFYLGRLFRGL
ncbi:MAG: hypothetical protein RDV48_07950 [Candidatus Eremiobacteraeota bacterium]|nr:hypothetical protein [Candidatus Eremiobacteraeota bacterium]